MLCQVLPLARQAHLDKRFSLIPRNVSKSQGKRCCRFEQLGSHTSSDAQLSGTIASERRAMCARKKKKKIASKCFVLYLARIAVQP